MMDANSVVVIVLAVLSSAVITRLVDGWFTRKNLAAETVATTADSGKTRAETADILAVAMERALLRMEHDLQRAQDRIMLLEARVTGLEATVVAYHDLHGPLPVTGAFTVDA